MQEIIPLYRPKHRRRFAIIDGNIDLLGANMSEEIEHKLSIQGNLTGLSIESNRQLPFLSAHLSCRCRQIQPVLLKIKNNLVAVFPSKEVDTLPCPSQVRSKQGRRGLSFLGEDLPIIREIPVNGVGAGGVSLCCKGDLCIGPAAAKGAEAVAMISIKAGNDKYFIDSLLLFQFLIFNLPHSFLMDIWLKTQTSPFNVKNYLFFFKRKLNFLFF